MGKFDTGGKRTLHLYARAWAEWVVAQQQLVLDAELSGEFQFVARATDVLLQVHDQEGRRYLVLTELQARYDSKMPRRLAAYAALAREKYDLDIYVVVIYLLPPPKDVTLPENFHASFMEQTAHQDFRVIRLWDLNADDALALNNPALIPFIPLMQGGDNEQTLRRCVARVQEEPEAEELVAVLALFAGLVMDKDVVRRIVGLNMHLLKESSLYQEITEMAREEGREEGREEEREAFLPTLRLLLAHRFEQTPEYFDRYLQRLDFAQLKQLGNVTLDAATVKEFEQALTQMFQEGPSATK